MKFNILIKKYQLFILLWLVISIISLGIIKINRESYLRYYPVILSYKLFNYPEEKILKKMVELDKRLAVIDEKDFKLREVQIEFLELLKERIPYEHYWDNINSVINFVNILFAFILAFFINYFYRKYNPVKYFICPNDKCNKSFLINYKWLCDKCKNIQNKEHFITDKCDVCGQELDTFVCEHCKREFIL